MNCGLIARARAPVSKNDFRVYRPDSPATVLRGRFAAPQNEGFGIKAAKKSCVTAQLGESDLSRLARIFGLMDLAGVRLSEI